MPPRSRTSQCPAQDCRATNPQQLDVPQSVLVIYGVTHDWASRAQRCTHCQCVYSIEVDGSRMVRGYLDSAIMGPGWQPLGPREKR